MRRLAIHRKQTSWNVQDLTEVGLNRWFEIGFTSAGEAEIVRLRELMKSDKVTRPFRSVLLDPNNQVCAKIGGYVTTNGRLTFWAVQHAPDADETSRLQASRQLVKSCVERAQVTSRVRYLETRPADDTVDLESFIMALRMESFDEIATAHFYTRPLKAPPPLPELKTELLCSLQFAPVRTVTPEEFNCLFEACQVDTLDRAQRDSLLSAQETLNELRNSAGAVAETELWSVALIDNKPVGFVLSQVSGDSDVAVKDAIIVELGVVPWRRRQRIGLHLTSSILQTLRMHGATSVGAVIDDENTPSIQLHETFGFMREPDSCWTWRRRL